MSTLVASNLSTGSKVASMDSVVEGSAKFQLNYNQVGTPSIRGSVNISSVSDVGTGQYTYNLTNAFDAADWSYAHNTGETNTSPGDPVNAGAGGTKAFATTGYGGQTRNGASAALDYNNNSNVGWGLLA